MLLWDKDFIFKFPIRSSAKQVRVREQKNGKSTMTIITYYNYVRCKLKNSYHAIHLSLPPSSFTFPPSSLTFPPSLSFPPSPSSLLPSPLSLPPSSLLPSLLPHLPSPSLPPPHPSSPSLPPLLPSLPILPSLTPLPPSFLFPQPSLVI